MKRCLFCNACYNAESTACLSCGGTPKFVDGFCAYAPELAQGGGGFKEEFFAELANFEDNNFWFRSRNRLITWALGKYCHNFDSFLEIGCGTGYVLSGVAQVFPDKKTTGSEIFATGLGFAAKRLPDTNLIQMDARNIPFSQEFDVVGAFDVLEHIEEDERVLAQVYNTLKPNGYAVLTVPQHPWLWSKADVHACHVRRYTKSALHRKFEAAGFKIMRSSSFVSLLLPSMAISRLLVRNKKAENFNPLAEFKMAPWMNKTFFNILSIELAAIKAGINFPVGGSRLIVAKKI
ncbi:MAG: SAM-dependent methyltransferase [Congregibacter sp.]|jgi:SAM-dependent methyltransferase